jgi:hypothetical protein
MDCTWLLATFHCNSAYMTGHTAQQFYIMYSSTEVAQVTCNFSSTEWLPCPSASCADTLQTLCCCLLGKRRISATKVATTRATLCTPHASQGAGTAAAPALGMPSITLGVVGWLPTAGINPCCCTPSKVPTAAARCTKLLLGLCASPC